MDEQQVRGILTWHNARWDTPARARMLVELTAIYEAEGVIVDGEPLALHRCCPSALDCWRQEQSRLPRVFHPTKQPTKHGESASIFWPWIGESYRPGGVCLVSLNINNDKRKDDGSWTIGVEYTISKTAIEVLEQGKHKPHRSWFAYRSMATALAVLASLDGQNSVERPTPQEAATAYDDRLIYPPGVSADRIREVAFGLVVAVIFAAVALVIANLSGAKLASGMDSARDRDSKSRIRLPYAGSRSGIPSSWLGGLLALAR